MTNGSMTKAELVEEVSRVSDLTKKHSEVIVDTVFRSIIEALHRGEKIELRGFGSFRLRKREPRKGRNPKTGDKVDVPPKKVPYFKPGKELKELINKEPAPPRRRRRAAAPIPFRSRPPGFKGGADSGIRNSGLGTLDPEPRTPEPRQARTRAQHLNPEPDSVPIAMERLWSPWRLALRDGRQRRSEPAASSVTSSSPAAKSSFWSAAGPLTSSSTCIPTTTGI